MRAKAISAIIASIALVLSLGFSLFSAQAADPIKVGFSLGLTGANAPNGGQLLLALEIWRDDVNAKGGLLGRPVELVYYDDQTNPSNEANLYTKMISVDKVDLLLGPYGTNQIAAALAAIAPHKLTTIGILGTAANSEIHYKNYFSMIPLGEKPKIEFSRGFFEMVAAQKPKPKTVALLGADAEFGKNAVEGARVNAKAAGLEIVYDKLYPPDLADLGPVVLAVKATNPDVVFIGAYPPDTVKFVNSAQEKGLVPKVMGGDMIGLLATPLKIKMGPLMNGYINNAEVFVPIPTFDFPGVKDLLAKYRERAKGKGIDPFGYNFAPYGYGAGQVLAAAVEGAKSLDHEKIADYMRSHEFNTVVGKIRFGKDGEWTKPRMLLTQWQGLKERELSEITDPKHWVVVWPPEHKTGNMIYPFGDARK
ncbi:MAG TPA: amino acid ABC transporter substrate-binding protein [Xanthobacteraceae bacterium]|nr:amino acid ABC transporter substrate-binding protein [Xanthobacteraceae bacterium]